MTDHACHATGCECRVPHNIFMCARHWRMVPRPLREAIGEGWSMGGGSPYRANCVEAIRVVSEIEGQRSIPGIGPGMKALTVWQPWASLIIIHAKPYEFRRWNFADRPALQKLIGQRIVIHAGARPPKLTELEDVIDRIREGESSLVPEIAEPFITSLIQSARAKVPGEAPLAAALGTAIIGEPHRCIDLFADKVADSDRIDQHMYAWPLTDIQPFPAPIPSRGAQGFWKWS